MSSSLYQHIDGINKNRSKGDDPESQLYGNGGDDDDEDNDDVPPSLLVEHGDDKLLLGNKATHDRPTHQQKIAPQTANHNVRNSTYGQRDPWDSIAPQPTMTAATTSSTGRIDPKQRAAWRWANVENLDVFFAELYSYYLGKGMFCIVLSRTVTLLTVAFVVSFSSFLTSCVDWSLITTKHSLEEIRIPHCMNRMGWGQTFAIWLVSLFWFLKVFQLVHDVRRLQELKAFYEHMLGISEDDMQTISWQHVVNQLIHLNDQRINIRTKKLTPHEIANRIMRKENYFIAMVNKSLLDVNIPIPFFTPFFTRGLEWNLSLCIMDFVFNDQGQVRPMFLKESHRKLLSQGLQRRFKFAAIMNLVCSPFIVIYLALLYFFKYFNEYRSDPGQFGSRQYTPYSEWKMRELNELFHLFERRINMSYLPASRYVNQFPKEKSAIICRFVAFLAGSFAAVLGIISLVDPELFLGFEITKDRTVLFYIGVFTSILAISRSMIPEETLVFDPETTLKYVSEFTHYMPESWKSRLHSYSVKNEFSQMYDLKIAIIIRELVGVLITPFVLWFVLPEQSDRLVDFFRTFSVHVDGLGYVCSFAMFNFDNHGHNKRSHMNNYNNSSDGKMLKSYLNFLDNYGETAAPEYHQQHLSGGNGGNGGGQQNVRRRPMNNLHSSLYIHPQVPEMDLENSVMGKFNRMHGSQYISKNNEMTGGKSTSGHDLFDSFIQEEEEEADVGADGGVLGLLNKFYKETDKRHI